MLCRPPPSLSDWQIQSAVCRLDTRTKTHKHWHTNTRHSKYNTDCKVCAGDKGEKEKSAGGGVGGCGQPERETQRVRERHREKTQRAERERDSHITSIFSWNVSVCGFNYALCRLTTKTWKLSRWIYKSTLERLAGTAELSCVGYEEHTDSDTWAAFRESAR